MNAFEKNKVSFFFFFFFSQAVACLVSLNLIGIIDQLQSINVGLELFNQGFYLKQSYKVCKRSKRALRT